MKNNYILFILLLALPFYGQQIQWANKVLKFSSDLGGKQYGIKRILGKPDAFPQGGNSANAWSPKNALNGKESVEVSFEKPQTVKQVAVFENLNAGCVAKISVDNGSGNYETVWLRKKDWKTPTFKATLPADHAYYFKRKRRKIQEAPDVLNPGIEHAILDNPVGNVVAVKVEFNFALLPGQKQIDAIGISDSETPLNATIATDKIFETIATPVALPWNDFEISNVAIAQDGKTLYFTHDDAQKNKIYSATKTADGNWSAPRFEPALSENETYNLIEEVTPNFILKGGNEYQRGTGECGFQIFTNTNGNYQAGDLIKIAAYNNYGTTSDATSTKDLKTIVLAVESDFTQGGTDFYFATKREDGSYGLLQNMGKVINSAEDEITPQLLSDTKTLLFSSSGFSSFGNSDLYVSYRLDATWKNWSEPINLGSKINGDGFEGSPFYDEKNEILYFSKSVAGKLQLYFVKIPAKDVMQR